VTSQTVDDLLQQAVQSQNNASSQGAIKVYSLSEMLAPQPRVEWIIQDLILPGSVALFAGAPGSKKTWCLLNLAACVASGKDWLGRPTRQMPVLIVDEESGRRRLFDRMGKVIRGLGLNDNLPLYATVMAGFDLRSDEGADALTDVIRQTNAGLVIIDALADVAVGADENSVKDVMPLMLNLRRIAEELDVAVCSIHHTNKANGQYRGSTAIAGAVDLLVTIRSGSKEALVQFEIEKTRDGEPGTFYGMAQWDSFADTFILTETAQSKTPKFSASEVEILEYLGAAMQATIDEIEQAVTSCSPARARRVIHALASGGWLERVNLTSGGRGQKAIYRLSKRGEDAYEKLRARSFP